jgi:pilus assembly protein CpaC
VPRFLRSEMALLAGLCALPLWSAGNDDLPRVQGPAAVEPQKLMVTVGKSLIIDSPVNIQRVSYANESIIDAVAINPKEVLINGKGAGETSLIIWQQGGTRLVYDLTVRPSPHRLEAVRQQLARDFPNDEINITYENDTAFVRGTVKDTIAADRVMAMVATLGKAVNLLRVEVPPAETQILLRVRFANVDRAASTDLGLSLASYAFNQATQISTGQFPGASLGKDANNPTITLSDALNILFFRRDLNLGVAIKALESKRLLETLAEPNVMAMNGKPSSFVSGGEFPIPMIQGGSGIGAVSIVFREFGIRINFLPHITPRGTIQLQVAPEVSSLDYSNAVTFQGYTIPALNTRRVQTEVELESGQSFAIAGLMDNRMTETMNKIPGLANIPLLGKLFTSKSAARNNSELLVIVTPEIVRPIEVGKPVPDLNFPQPFLKRNTDIPLRQPGLDQTGPVPVKPTQETMPLEQLIQQRKEGQPAPQPTVPQYMMVPVSGDATPPGGPPSGGQPIPAAAPKPGGGNNR